MSWYAIHDSDDGDLRSLSSTLSAIANPLPAGLSVTTITDEEGMGLVRSTHFWQASTRTVVAKPPDNRSTNLATLVQRATNFITNVIPGRRTALAQDRANAQLTAFMGLAALTGSATTNNVRDRTIQQDLAIKALIAIMSRALASEDTLLLFANEQIILDGQFLSDLDSLLNGPLPT